MFNKLGWYIWDGQPIQDREICMDRENITDFKYKPKIKIVREDALKCRCGIEMELLLMWATLHCRLRVNSATCLFR